MTKDEILEWLKVHNKNNEYCQYTINDDMSIDVDGSVNLIEVKDNRIPDGIKFNIVSGNFDCSKNKLTSLDGSPKEVGGIFYCNSNNLTTLKGCPEIVKGDFDCTDNKLTTLNGCPKEVGNGFYCYDNKLTTLEGCPEKVGSNFYCNGNKLSNLKYMPVINIKDTYCTDFTKEEVNIEQDIMKEVKTYEEGVQAYQECLDIFGDD